MAGQPDFPYTPVPANLKRLLEKIPKIGIPEKADQNWLAAAGFPTGNDKSNLALLRQVGVIDSDGAPTDLWRALRHGRAAFGAGIKKAYAALFSMYGDADRQDDEALMAFARARTDYAEATQKYAVRTFKVFTGFGDFDGALAPAAKEPAKEKEPAEERQPAGNSRGGRQISRRDEASSGVGLTVNSSCSSRRAPTVRSTTSSSPQWRSISRASSGLDDERARGSLDPRARR